MLAHRYADQKHKLSFPCSVQPKLNGIRMLYRYGTMQSRSHGQDEPKTWLAERLAHLRTALARVPQHLIFDGEIYTHGWSLQQINAQAAVNRLSDTDKTYRLQYHVFDIINTNDLNASFQDRFSFLTNIVDTEIVKFVPTFRVITPLEADGHFARFKADGYEGMMYRQHDVPYGLSTNCGNKENRWPILLKRKDWLDEICEILDYQITTGTKGERGFQMSCRFINGNVFTVGSGLSHAERDRFEHSPPIGQHVKVKYEMLSDGEVPLKPSIEEVYEN